MKYWRVEREEYVTQVAHVQAETKEEALELAVGKFESVDSRCSGPWFHEMTEREFKEETEE